MEPNKVEISVLITSDVDASIHRNNYKLTADKIIQILEVVRDEGKKSRRRWIWELMQNAKDVPNVFNRVSVKFHLANDKLIFCHNGDPFNINNITGLIQQVSSKHSNNEDSEVTGKFGTGFISTHLLSDIINVSGVVTRPNNVFRRFSIDLDRSSDTSEGLLPGIEESLEHIRKIDSDEMFPVADNFLQSRTEDDFDTVFTYTLKDDNSKTAAKVGIADLQYTLPFTMVNISKIKEVLVVNDVEKSAELYSCSIQELEKNIKSYTISIKDLNSNIITAKTFIAFVTEQVRLVTEVDSIENLCLIDLGDSQPYLYRDFPLIGTEKFYQPFVVNGVSFHPTERRDKILLNGNNEKAKHNRALIEKTKEISLLFSDWLISKNAHNLFKLVNTGLPEIELEDDTQKWYENLQKEWRNSLLDKKIVETTTGNVILREAIIPQFTDNPSENEVFYKLLAQYDYFNLMPKVEILEKWHTNLGKVNELFTWGKDMFFTHKNLLSELEQLQNLQRVAELKFNNSEERALSWLNNLFNFIIEFDSVKILNEYKVIPNKRGQFDFLDNLHLEKKTEPIPELLLSILIELDIDWYAKLIKKEIQLNKVNHKELGLLDASEIFNQEIYKESIVNSRSSKIFLQNPKAQEILSRVLSLTSKESEDDSFRSKLFSWGKELFHFNHNLEIVESLKGLSFDRSTRLYIELCNEKISSTKKLDTLAQVLNRDLASSCIWLNDYLQFILSSSQYKYLIEVGNIIPNRYGDLSSYVDMSNFGTPEQPLDEILIGVLKGLTRGIDLNTRLLNKNFTITLKESFKFEELASLITEEISIITSMETFEDYRDPILTLINWSKKHKILAQQFLPDFFEKSNRYFYILAIEKSENSEQIFGLLKNKESLKHLVAISESGIDLTLLNKLVDVAKNQEILKELIDHAIFLKKEKEDFDYLLNIGNLIEQVFGHALNSEIDHYDISYIGIGSHDYKVKNRLNQKEFFIEIKSFSIANQNEPIMLSISQAKLSVNAKHNFALCTVPRPKQAKLVNEEYLKRELAFIGTLSDDAAEAIKSYNLIDRIIHLKSDIFIEAVRPEFKMGISRSYIETRKSSFLNLVQEIKKQLE